MNYQQIRGKLYAGDVFLVRNEGLFGKVIRVFTAESVSHVALILPNEDTGVWVAEMMWKGFRMVPASQWIEENKKNTIYWGLAPSIIRQRPKEVRRAALEYRGRAYSYWTLVTTWISQVIKSDVPHGAVCSTFVQDVWEKTGYSSFEQVADPGDFFDHCAAFRVVPYKGRS